MAQEGRSSQLVLETIGTDSANVRHTQLVIESIGIDSANTRFSQSVAEVIGLDSANVRHSQIVVEVIGRLVGAVISDTNILIASNIVVPYRR